MLFTAGGGTGAAATAVFSTGVGDEVAVNGSVVQGYNNGNPGSPVPTPTGIPIGARIIQILDTTHFKIDLASDLTVSGAAGTVGPLGFDESPSPVVGTGTATAIGFNLAYNAADPGTGSSGSVTASDVTNQPGTANPGFNENIWRVRGGGTDLTGGAPTNGWSNNVPQYTQGAQFSVPTTGYNNVYITLDWYGTQSGERDLQEQYTTDGTTWTNINNLNFSYPDEFYGAIPNGDSSTNDNIVPLVIDVSKIPNAQNNANFGIRLVAALRPHALQHADAGVR